MSRYRCDCGDTECPSCGAAQGTYFPPDLGDMPTRCAACGVDRELLQEDGGSWDLCPQCTRAAKRAITETYLPEPIRINRQRQQERWNLSGLFLLPMIVGLLFLYAACLILGVFK